MNWYTKLFKSPAIAYGYLSILLVCIALQIFTCWECENVYEVVLNTVSGVGIIGWLVYLAYKYTKADWKKKKKNT